MSVDLFSEPISRLLDVVIYVARTTSNFKPQLRQLKNTLERITPIIADIQNQNRKLNCTQLEQDMFKNEIEDAKELVDKCSRIKWNIILKLTHSLKLKDLNQKLLSFFQIEVQAVQCRDIKAVLKEVNHVNKNITSLAFDVSRLGDTSSGGSMAESSAGRERKQFGWRVPSRPGGIVGFDETLKKLTDKVLSVINTRKGHCVVVSAAGGCGKTTLVKMLCHDPQIQEHFGENVFFVTVSESPDFMLSVNDLFNPNSFNQQVKFQGYEDAKNKLETFLREKVSGPILLVLDDVWLDSYIKNFEFDIKGYKLLVTSRMIFTEYYVFKFDPLRDEDAKLLFRNSAGPIPTIEENLVDQMARCCKKHPLTLSVVGSFLNGKDEVVWRRRLKSLSQGRSVLDQNKEVLNRLERSFDDLENEFKECYLDFGLFQEDESIPASALLDMWAHLYNHDDEGIDTVAKIYELSYRNLLNVTRENDYPYATVNYCENQFVTQHDLLRQLAINLNSKLPIAKRTRLIISAQNDLLTTSVHGDHIASIEQMQEPMQARILSISTGKSFSSRWCYMFYLTTIKDIHLLGCLSNLTRIRFECVAISSLGRSTLALVNLKKVSFISCDIGNAFEVLSIENLNVWPRLVEFEMDLCYLVKFPRILCSSVNLRKLSITKCPSLHKISEEFGNLTSLETLILHSCFILKKLPETITKLHKLSIIDISNCTKLNKLPEQMGSLVGLRTIYMISTGVHELPPSVKDLSYTKVVCDEKIACQWKEFPNVEVNVVQEDIIATFKTIKDYIRINKIDE